MNADPGFEQARAEFLAGLACQQAGDFLQAERHYQASLQHLPGRPSTLVNLAATQLQLGQLAAALASADAALSAEADSADALLHRGSALAQLGRPADALTTFERLNAIAPEHPVAWSHRGSLLRELGRTGEARAAFQQALQHGAERELHGYYLAALGAQEAPPAPPREYVQRLFDGYAGDFDAHLLGRLGYRAHIELVDRVRAGAAGLGFTSALDLGCGTGLCGPLMRPLTQRLVGLDLSAAMLAQARDRGVYDALVQADAIDYLAVTAERFDLVLAADVLIYIGDPTPLLAAASRVMTQGLFAFTVEVGEDNATGCGWQLLPSLRYAHDPGWLAQQAPQHGFSVLQMDHAPVRCDQGRNVDGLYVVLRREPGACGASSLG